MSKKLRQYLYELYAVNGFQRLNKLKKDFPIQIDDQDDNDRLDEFCNIFVTVGKNNRMEIELSGGIPITREIADFVEIYNGRAEPSRCRLLLTIHPGQIEALKDLARRIKDTAELGYASNNPNWKKISARTVSSLYRFMRVIKEYGEMKKSGLM